MIYERRAAFTATNARPVQWRQHGRNLGFLVSSIKVHFESRLWKTRASASLLIADWDWERTIKVCITVWIGSGGVLYWFGKWTAIFAFIGTETLKQRAKSVRRLSDWIVQVLSKRMSHSMSYPSYYRIQWRNKETDRYQQVAHCHCERSDTGGKHEMTKCSRQFDQHRVPDGRACQLKLGLTN